MVRAQAALSSSKLPWVTAKARAAVALADKSIAELRRVSGPVDHAESDKGGLNRHIEPQHRTEVVSVVH